ncbi:hypothetical protein [Eggerthella sp. YY7918]|uniref:hypothetical protein n=1 Tax=Eggerthella sp. (strain YY7918) TaxID=502558 RepID=UPI00021716DE|nr:hypothetical protein [Eggerthella sp. YY7918]BAK45581.1 hypothetical protein EGYY_25290 [Eggerthella sp. YY7918]
MDIREKYYPNISIEDDLFKKGVIDAFWHVYNRTESEERHLRMISNDSAREYLDDSDYSIWIERKKHYGIAY